jgi:glutamine synthetase
MATFMAKWSPDYPGQSGHIHISLQDKNNKSVFFDKGAPFRMSRLMRAFVAGQQQYMPEMLGMVANTVNSYSRLVPGAWAPTSATWGVENRTTALRVIPGSAKSQRVEYRIAAADCNPYLALAASIGSGALGIQEGLNLSPPVKGNAYTQDFPESTRLPNTLWDAAQMLKGSTAARGLFGDAFVEHYTASREWEERQHRKAVTDWELQRYFEII